MRNGKMTPYQRVMAALHGEQPDKIPFTVYECMIPQCTAERELRDRGLCVVYRRRSYRSYTPNVNVSSSHFTDEKGRNLIKTTYSTPVGELSDLRENVGFTSWTYEHLFKSPDDYKALLFILRDTVFEQDYDSTMKTVADLGEDFVVRDQIALEPLQGLISNYMGSETFSYEWMDNRDEVMKLYEVSAESNRRIYDLVANGPLEFANYGGNVVPQIIGVDTFRQCYVPHYNEAAEVLHKKGKLLGCHFDADNTLIMGDIASTGLDYIEAYDAGSSPPIEAARKAWPDKVLWLNWPSAWHLQNMDEVKAGTLKLIEESGTCRNILIGITENVPEDRWKGNYAAIMDVIDQHGTR